MTRQTERELLRARKKIGYEELTVVETVEDVDMEDVEMGEARMVDADEAAAHELSKLSISESAKKSRRILVPRGPRRRGKFSYQSNKAIASEQVHQRVRLHDPDRIMADDRRGGGGYNRKRRYNRGIQPMTQNTFIDCRAELIFFVYRR